VLTCSYSCFKSRFQLDNLKREFNSSHIRCHQWMEVTFSLRHATDCGGTHGCTNHTGLCVYEWWLLVWALNESKELTNISISQIERPQLENCAKVYLIWDLVCDLRLGSSIGMSWYSSELCLYSKNHRNHYLISINRLLILWSLHRSLSLLQNRLHNFLSDIQEVEREKLQCARNSLKFLTAPPEHT